jgi:Sec63 Brl domain
LTTEERRALGLYDNPAHFEDCEKTIKSFPVIDLNVTYEVEGEKEIAVNDLLTIKISVTHVNLEDKQSLGFVHSNKFPYLKRSSWYLVFTDAEDNVMMGMDKLVIGEKVHVKEMKDRMARPGSIELNFHLKNDSYRGFDKRHSIKFTVLKEVKRETVEYDNEDLDAQKAPSLMQSMMEVNNEGGASDDELSEDETVASKVDTKKDK